MPRRTKTTILNEASYRRSPQQVVLCIQIMLGSAWGIQEKDGVEISINHKTVTVWQGRVIDKNTVSHWQVSKGYRSIL